MKRLGSGLRTAAVLAIALGSTAAWAQPALDMAPREPTVPPGGHVTFLVLGGTMPYSFQLVDDMTLDRVEAVDSTHCRFDAYGPADRTVTVSATDAAGTTVSTTVTIGPNVTAIGPTDPVVPRSTFQLRATGGSGIYKWSFVQNNSFGTVDANS